MRTVVGIVIALLGTGSVKAAEVANASWSRTPSWAEMQAAYPATAKASSGSVTLRCTVGAAGVLIDCKNQDEKPDGQGFYEAALMLAPLFVIAATTVSTPVAGDTVDVPFNFTRSGPKASPKLLRPKWVNQMGVAEARSLFPATAPPQVSQGAAVVRCQINAEGLLKPCSVLSETPKNAGFAGAALATAERMVMNPWSEGFPVEGQTLTFQLTFSR